MNTDLFLDQFGDLVESPDGIQKLRNLILDLAVRGQLSSRDAEDEPADELIKRIKQEQEWLLKASELKKLNKLPPIEDIEKPYDLPYSWAWTRLARIGLINPRNDLDEDLLVSFIPMTLISEKFGEPPLMEERLWSEVRKGYTHFQEGDVALAKITPCFQNGKACVMRNLLNGAGAGTTELHIFRDVTTLLNVDYIYIFLKSPTFVNNGIPLMTGTAGQKRVPKDYFSSAPFPLPPLAEQHRIVARVDELMELCDQLEEQQAHKQHLQDRAAKSTLYHLANASNKREALEYWQQAEENFHDLFDQVDTIEDLRATILQLAVQGRLVPQDPDDEPASELLKQINQEREWQLTASELKKLKKLPPIEDDEKPYELHYGWEWVRLGKIIELISGRHLKPEEYLDEYDVDTIPYITGPAEFGPIHPTASKYTFEKSSVSVRGDILITVKGAGVGKLNVNNFDELAISRQLMAIRPLIQETTPYLYYLLHANYEHFQEEGIGTTVPGLSRIHVQHLSVPCPPLAEQQRIVAKVDELMELCDQLEEAVTQSSDLSARLMDSIIYHLFEPAEA